MTYSNGMNMMTVLLGATGLLLVAALALSFGSLRDGTADPEVQNEIAALKAEIITLQQQEAQLLAMRAGSRPASPSSDFATPPGIATPPPVANGADEAAGILTASDEHALKTHVSSENQLLKDQIEEMSDQIEESERRAQTYKDEAGLAWQQQIEAHDQGQRRARIIREALLIATVTEWSEEDGFAVISLQRPENVQTGTVLGIRRNGGLLGQLKVAQIYPEDGMATADPHIFPGGSVDIQAGDELIVPPL